jgi:uncharacterized protein YegP (UPF0339 family)
VSARRARFQVYQDRAGEWRWRLRAANGQIVADSAEGYTRKHDAERAVETTLRTAGQAVIALQEAARR